MKKRRLKSWVKIVIIVVILIGAILMLDNFRKQDEVAIVRCIAKGYSEDYCVRGLYGN